jgi:hypothetical protein
LVGRSDGRVSKWRRRRRRKGKNKPKITTGSTHENIHVVKKMNGTEGREDTKSFFSLLYKYIDI